MSEYKTRLAAAQRGEKIYQGKDCAEHHGGLRYTSNGVCVVCMKAKAEARQHRIRDLLKRDAG